MFSEINNISPEAVYKYGITVSCRIPALLHKEIGNEAALRGISIAKHLSSLVQLGHHQEASTNAEINILIRERENLQKEVQALTKQLEKHEQKLQQQEQQTVAQQVGIATGIITAIALIISIIRN